MQLNCIDRQLYLATSDLVKPQFDVAYGIGWLDNDIYTQSARCAIILAHFASFTIIDPHLREISHLVDDEIYLFGVRNG